MAEGEAAGGEWSNGLCGCFGDCKLCIITYIAPCYVAGKTAESVGESCFKFGCFSVLPIANIVCGAKIREKIREQKGIAGSFGNDCIMHWFCALCAYVQEAREMNSLNTVGAEIDQAMARE